MKKIILVLMLAFGVGMTDEKGESYYSYFEKGNEAFLAKKYKQAEIHYKKACEKQAPNDDYSAFKDFRQNCNAHSAMEYFDKVCNEFKIANYAHQKDNENEEIPWDYSNDEVEYCMQLGDMYYEGNKEMGVEKNIPLAKKYWAKYLFSSSLSCYGRGNCDSPSSGWEEYKYHILDYLESREKPEYEEEVKPDYTKARLLAESACENDKPIEQACEILGDIYAQGKGVKQDLNKAKAFYQKACENPLKHYKSDYYPCGGMSGYTTITHFGCKQLGDIYYLGKNFKEAEKWWKKAVKEQRRYDEKTHRRQITGYYQEAERYYNGYVITEEDKYDKRRNLIKKGTYIKHEQDYTKAVLLASIGCIEFKNFKSCSILANAYTQGKGTKQNLNLAQYYLTKANQYEAKALYEQAKELGYEICVVGGDGEFDEAKQRAQIKKLLQQACNLDKSNQACIDLKNKSYEKWNLDNVY